MHTWCRFRDRKCRVASLQENGCLRVVVVVFFGSCTRDLQRKSILLSIHGDSKTDRHDQMCHRHN